jgi:hypothetical protein
VLQFEEKCLKNHVHLLVGKVFESDSLQVRNYQYLLNRLLALEKLLSYFLELHPPGVLDLREKVFD